jgi:uncharacterized membrane protein (DUF485 family)
MKLLCEGDKNRDQSFRVSYVVLRFFLSFTFLAVPLGGIVWWTSKSWLKSLPFVIFAFVFSAFFSIRAYIALGRLMKEIEAKRDATTSVLASEQPAAIDASNPPPGA